MRMNGKAWTMALIFFTAGLFFIWYAGFDLLNRNIGTSYGVFSVLVLSIMGAQFWNE